MHDTASTISSFTECLRSGTRGTGWYLNFLAVDPAYQNQGHGRVLAAWGVEQAKQENVTASVLSGMGKDRFYWKFGFLVWGGHVSDGVGTCQMGRAIH